MEWKIEGLPTPETKSDYFDLSQKILLDRGFHLITDDWQMVSEAKDWDDVTIEKKDMPGSSIVAVRVTGFIKLQKKQTINDLAHTLFNPTNDFECRVFETISGYERLRVINKNIVVGRAIASSAGMTDREFVAMRTIEPNDEGYLIAVQSINDQNIPHHPDRIRGTYRTGLQLTPVTDQVVQAIMFAHIDPRGWIPDFLINYHIKTSGDWIKRV